jgi:ABC-type multidrug transport system fused ATPase/permease subunit
MNSIRKILLIRSGNQALAFSIPAIAAVLSFVTYSSIHSNLDPVGYSRLLSLTCEALIFTSLAFFNLLRQPLLMLPRGLSSLSDAQTAVERLTTLFEADTSEWSNHIDPDLDVAIRVMDASFQWASVKEPELLASEKNQKGRKSKKDKNNAEKPEERVADEAAEPFSIHNLNMEVARGRLVAIVGPVSSGKSSILQGVS